jgi:hypothetical protein
MLEWPQQEDFFARKVTARGINLDTMVEVTSYF